MHMLPLSKAFVSIALEAWLAEYAADIDPAMKVEEIDLADLNDSAWRDFVRYMVSWLLGEVEDYGWSKRDREQFEAGLSALIDEVMG